MLHFIGDFKEYAVAEQCRRYIPLYLKRKDDAVCFVPYNDDNLQKVRYIKYALLNGEWCYVDNSQES